MHENSKLNDCRSIKRSKAGKRGEICTRSNLYKETRMLVPKLYKNKSSLPSMFGTKKIWYVNEYLVASKFLWIRLMGIPLDKNVRRSISKTIWVLSSKKCKSKTVCLKCYCSCTFNWTRTHHFSANLCQKGGRWAPNLNTSLRMTHLSPNKSEGWFQTIVKRITLQLLLFFSKQLPWG